MTLPYSRFPLDRALTGHPVGRLSLRRLGDDPPGGGRAVPVLAPDAHPTGRRSWRRCRDLGLEPLMMFSGIYPEAHDAPEVLMARVRQAAAAGVPQVLTFGHTRGGNRKLWVERLRSWARWPATTG